MKKAVAFTLCLLHVSTLLALPEGTEVISGEVTLERVDPSHLKFEVSDRAILHHRNFNIDKGEHVEFIQPSSKSTVLNRVTSHDPTDILGRLSSNGRLFLINPNGVCFGPDAVVNTGSFVVSTLDIRNDDFLADRFHFFQTSSHGKIVNQGAITATPEGFIALIAPVIQNRGSILARAGRVVLAAGERVTLDFSGDGLLQFTVDGELERALIENAGKIEAAGGVVDLSLLAAQRAIKMVVNTDGISPATDIDDAGGIIRLTSSSLVSAESGVVRVIGEKIDVQGGTIDVSGAIGGGTILVGGNYQGLGPERNATTTAIGPGAILKADALERGHGGKIVVWSDDTTVFDGMALVRGGPLGGDGGFVETSGKMTLGVNVGHVDASAPLGLFGDWLLDPGSVTIRLGGGGTLASVTSPNCGTNGNIVVDPSTIAVAAANVTICAQRNANSSITVTDPVTMTNSGVSLTLTAGSTSLGAISLNNSLTTRGAPITLNGVVTVGATVQLDTTNGGASPAGGNIAFSNTLNGAQTLTLNGGTGGAVTFSGAVGGTTPLAALSATGTTITQTSTATVTGALNYTGSTAISLGGNITTASGAVSLTGPSTISTSITIDTTNGGGSTGAGITCSTTLNGSSANTQDLTLRAGSGAISIGGTVGGNVPLRTLSVVSCSNWSAAAITASSISQSAGSGTTTWNGAINTSGSGGVVVSGTNFAWNNTITAATTGPLQVTHSGTLTIGAGLTLTAGGGFSDNGLGPTTLLGGLTIATTGTNVSFTPAITLAGTTSINTGTGVGNISFVSTLNGAQNLTLAANNGNITFTGAVGGTTRLNTVTISSANNVTANALSAVVLTQSAGSGTTTFNGAVSLTGGAGFTFTGNNISINNTFSTALSGPVSITNAGTCTLGSGAALSLDGPFTESGMGTVQLAGSITTTNDTIQFGKAVVLTGATSLNTGMGVGDINFLSTVDGLASLALTAGTGNVSFSQAVGGNTRIGALSVNSATGITTVGVRATSVNFTGFTGTASLTGVYDTNGASGVVIAGNVVNRTGALTATGSGGCTITNSGQLTSTGSMTLDGSFVQNGAGSVSIRDTIVSNAGNISFAENVTLTNGVTLNTSPGNGSITLSKQINATSAGAQSLTLSSGTGTISVVGNVGATTQLGTLQVSSAGQATFSGSVNATSITQLAGSGLTTFNGSVTTTTGSGIVLGGTSFSVLGSVTTTTGSGVFSVTHTGTLTIGPSATLNLGGNFTQNGTGSSTLQGIVTTPGSITLSGPVVASGGSLTGAPIQLLSTTNGTSSGVGNLTLTSTGAVSLGAIGGTTPMGALTITNATSVGTGAIAAQSITQSMGSGTTTFGGAVTTTGPISVTTANFVRGGSITTTNSGALTLNTTGTVTTTAAGAIALDGAFTQSGGTGVSLSGTITTTTDAVSFAAPITLMGGVSVSTAGGNITFNGAIDGPYNVSLSAGGGDISLQGNIGSGTRIGAFTVSNCANFNLGTNIASKNLTASSVNITENGGTLNFYGNVNTNTAAGIVLNVTNIYRGGDYIASAGGVVSLTFSGTSLATPAALLHVGSLNVTCTGPSGVFFGGTVITDTGGIEIFSPVTFLADGTADTSLANGDLHFHSTVNGTHNVTCTLGSGNLYFDGAVGALSPFGTVTINSANNVTFGSSFKSGAITQVAGSGTTTFSGDVTASGTISIATHDFVRGGAITTTGGGGLTVNVPGTVTSTAAGAIGLDGPLSVTNAAAVNISGAITTTADAINFSAPVMLMGATNWNSAGGAISATTIDGGFGLTLASGSGNITATGAIGGSTRLGAISVSGCADFTVQSLTASSLTINNSTGTIQFNGDVNTNGATGIQLLNVHNVHRGGGYTATGGGPLYVTFDGTVTSSSSLPTLVGSVDITSTGVGGIELQGTVITDTAGVDYHGPVTLLGPETINTAGSGGNIHFYSTVGGGKPLVLSSGTGNIFVDGAMGVSSLTISSANNATLGAVSAGTVVQTAGSGKTTFGGAVSTTALGGVVLTGNQFEFDGTITTMGSGPLTVVNSGTLTVTQGATIGGAISQSGTGGVSLAGSITAGGVVGFAGGTTLSGATSVTTAASNILFGGSIDGGNSLTLDSGTGDVSVVGVIGGGIRLGALTITNSTNTTMGAVSATSLTQSAGTGVASYGVIDTIGDVVLVGHDVTLSGITTSTGGVHITNSGALVQTGTSSLGGSYLQDGLGGVSSSGSITTANQPITFTRAVVLTGSETLAAGTGNISFMSTIDGSHILTLSGQDVTFGGTIGGTTALNQLVVGSCRNISYPITFAGKVDQESSSGTTTVGQPITTTGGGGITLKGTTITQSSTLQTSTGAVVIENSGLYTMGGSVISGSSFSQSGGSVALGGNVTTTNSVLIFGAPMTLTGGSVLTSGGGAITLSSVVDGAFNLTLAAGTGAINLNGAVGGTTRLGTFKISSGEGSTTGLIKAGVIQQLAGSTTFGVLDTNLVGGISLQGSSFTLGGNVTTTAGGPLVLQNSGPSVLSGTTFSISGAFNQTGLGSVTLSSGVTAGGSVQCAGPIIAAGGSLTGTSINFINTVNGASSGVKDLTLSSTGAVQFQLPVGGTTAVGALSITTATNVTTVAVNAQSITQSMGSGTTTFGGAVTASGPISVTTANFVRGGSITTTNSGALTLNTSGTVTSTAAGDIALDGALTQSGGTGISLLGTITTTTDPISFGVPITLMGGTSITTAGGNITFVGAVDGGYDLEMTAGGGDITAMQPIGSTTRLGTLTVYSCHNFTGSGMKAAAVSITEIGGTIQTSGNFDTNTAAGVTLNANNIIRGGSVTASGGGALTVVFSGSTMTTGAFPITVGSISVTSIGMGAINFGGVVTTDTGGIELHSPVNFLAPAVLNTSAAGGDIHFYSSVNGTNNINCTLGTGNLYFDGAVGAAAPLGTLTVNSATNVTFGSSFKSGAITQVAGSGTTTFGGDVTASGTISIATHDFVRGGAITTTGGGGLTVNVPGTVTSTAAGAIGLDGPLSVTNAAAVNISGAITTTADAISFSAPVMLMGATNWNSAGGAISATTIDGGFGLTLASGSGNITATGAIGGSTRLGAISVSGCADFTVQSLTASSLTINNSTGTIQFNGDVNTNGATGIQLLNVHNVHRGGGYTATGGGPLYVTFDGIVTSSSTLPTLVGSVYIQSTGVGDIELQGTVITDTAGVDYDGPVTLLDTETIDTTISGGNIHFYSTVSGGQSLVLSSGSGNIFVDGAMGVTSLTISSANNATLGAVSAGTVVQTAGSGKTIFGGAVSTTALGGVVLTGSQFEFDGTITTMVSGPLTVVNSGTLTVTQGATIGGAISQSGTGGVSLAGSITAGGVVGFAGGTTLSGATSVTTAASNITFGSTIDGGNSLTLDSGTGDINVVGVIGGGVRLGALTITNSDNTTMGAVSATSLTQSAGAGLASYGAIDTTGSVVLQGNDITLIGVTTAVGNVHITNSGTLTQTGVSTIGGSYLQDGLGAVNTNGSLSTNNQPITFTAGVTLTGGESLAAGAGDISFMSTVNGNQILTLSGRDIAFGGTIGGATSLNQLVVGSCRDISYPITFAGKVDQQNSSGVTTISQPITTTGGGGISLNGTTITQSSTLQTTTGAIVVANTGLYTMGGSVVSGSSFNQSGGSVSLGGNVTTTNGALIVGAPITLTNGSQLTSGGGPITLSSAVDGSFNLTLAAGTGAITLNGAVGGTTRLGTFKINSGVGSTTGPIKAGVILQLAGSTTFGVLDTNLVGGISLQGSNFTLGGNVTTTTGGPLVIQNSGATTLSGAIFTIAGAVNQTGLGAITLSSSITSLGSVQFTAPIGVSGASSLTGSSIVLNQTVNGPSTLSCNTGSGAFHVVGDIGNLSRLSGLTVSQSGSVELENVTVGPLSVVSTGLTLIHGDINATGPIGVAGVDITLDGDVVTTGGGSCTFTHSGVLKLNGGTSTLSGPFSEFGGGVVQFAGSLTTSNQSISFGSPFTLIGAGVVNGQGGSVTFSSTIDGPYDLWVGSGDLVVTGAVGMGTPVRAFTIGTANNVTLHALSCGKFIQQSGSSETQLLGSIITTDPEGFSFTGNTIKLLAPLTTQNGGVVGITNGGVATLSSPILSDGAFTQNGAGAVSLCTTITTTADAILFQSPVTLCGDAVLDTGPLFGPINFSSTIDGPHHLTLSAGGGTIGIGGATSVQLFEVTSGLHLTTASITAGAIDIVNITGTGLFNGDVVTTAVGGVTISGAEFQFLGNLTTQNGGSVSITETNHLTLGPTTQVTVDGSFTQSGSGVVSIGGGVTTTGHPITFGGSISLSGDLALTSNNGNVNLTGGAEGPYVLTINAGAGDVSIPTAISVTSPLSGFWVNTAAHISLNGVGSASTYLAGPLNLAASDTITLNNSNYACYSLNFTPVNSIEFIYNHLTTLSTNGGPIVLGGPIAHLNSGDLAIQTQGGVVTFHEISSTGMSNMMIDTGSGSLLLGALTNLNTLQVAAGEILFDDAISVVNADFVSLHAISNYSSVVNIVSTNTASFNALDGDVGTLTSPIEVYTTNQIFAGAADTAVFIGSSTDNTVHPIPSNPPCDIYWNGDLIQSCTRPPTPPVPPFVPGGVNAVRFDVPIPGVESSYFNWASDYYFLPLFLSDDYLQRPNLLYFRT